MLLLREMRLSTEWSGVKTKTHVMFKLKLSQCIYAIFGGLSFAFKAHFQKSKNDRKSKTKDSFKVCRTIEARTFKGAVETNTDIGETKATMQDLEQMGILLTDPSLTKIRKIRLRWTNRHVHFFPQMVGTQITLPKIRTRFLQKRW